MLRNKAIPTPSKAVHPQRLPATNISATAYSATEDDATQATPAAAVSPSEGSSQTYAGRAANVASVPTTAGVTVS